MRHYDQDKPLIYIHNLYPYTQSRGHECTTFPFCLVRRWPNHTLPKRSTPPKPHDLEKLHSRDRPIALYGHFNIGTGYGLHLNYPEIEQFATILRDPFELSVSLYYFVRKRFADGHRKSLGVFADNLEDYLLKNRSHILNHFPREVTFSNYREIIDTYFIEIGIAEDLASSMKRLAAALGKNYEPALLGRHNAAARDQQSVEHIKPIFAERNQLEYEIYNLVKARFQRPCPA